VPQNIRFGKSVVLFTVIACLCVSHELITMIMFFNRVNKLVFMTDMKTLLYEVCI